MCLGLGCRVPTPSPALSLPPGRAGPPRPPGVRGEAIDELLAGPARRTPSSRCCGGQRGQGGLGGPSAGMRTAGRPTSGRPLAEPPPPPPAAAWLTARRGCPLGAGQAGPRPAGPGGRRPRQWALVPRPQALGQSLGRPAGSPRALSAPRDQAPPGSPAAPTPPWETGASQVSTPSPLSPSSGPAPVDWVWAAGGGWLFDGAPPPPSWPPLSLSLLSRPSQRPSWAGCGAACFPQSRHRAHSATQHILSSRLCEQRACTVAASPGCPQRLQASLGAPAATAAPGGGGSEPARPGGGAPSHAGAHRAGCGSLRLCQEQGPFQPHGGTSDGPAGWTAGGRGQPSRRRDLLPSCTAQGGGGLLSMSTGVRVDRLSPSSGTLDLSGCSGS